MIPLLLAALCIAANGFMVAAEFAFAKVRPTSLEALSRAGDEKAVRALDMTRRLDAYLSATQLGITLASLALGWLGEPAIADLLTPLLSGFDLSETVIHGISYTVAFATISLLHIVLGELVPKSIAIQYPEQVARWTARTLDVFFKLTWPAMWVLNGLSNFVLRSLRLPPASHGDGKLSAQEIRVIIQASFADHAVADRKRDLLERVLRSTDRPIRAAMVPRVDVVVLSTTSTAEEAIGLARKHGYSRYPLCEGGDPDHVIGYVHVKDLFAVEGRSASLLEQKRDVLFLAESAKVGDVLSEFQLTSTPFGIVVDEYGGTDGIVTIEDVVEEMVGEIHDEHDSERPRIVEREDGTLSVDAAIIMGELDVEGLGLNADEEDDTVGGFVVERLGRLARTGDRVHANQWDLTVEVARRRRIRRVLFSKRADDDVDSSEERG